MADHIINNVEIMGLDSSILASGYPMITDIKKRDIGENDIKRCNSLTKLSRENGAHGQFLTGIRVNFDLTFSNKAWVEAERYRFLEFVSSQSTMHRITKFDVKEQCNNYVDPRIIDILNEKIHNYNVLKTLDTPVTEERIKKLNDLYLDIVYNIPSGFRLTARMTTNYRCLINIYNQRHDHRLPEWREFCNEILSLPYMKDFLCSYGVFIKNKEE